MSLLEPTTYSATDRIGGGKAVLTVKRDPKRTRNLKNLEPIYVEVKQGTMQPRESNLCPPKASCFASVRIRASWCKRQEKLRMRPSACCTVHSALPPDRHRA